MKTGTTRSKAAKKKTTRAGAVAAKPAVGLAPSLAQLASIRGRFHALPPTAAAALLAQHDDASCRAQGISTKASDTFNGAMNWARTFGEHADDRGLQPQMVRWFLDCLTALGNLLSGHAVASNPSHGSALDDSIHHADKLLTTVTRQARDAVGSNDVWRTTLESALAVPEGLDARMTRLTALAQLLAHWLDSRAAAREPSPPLTVYGITGSTVVSLQHAATVLSTALVNKPAVRQIDRDSPEVNAAEGRLYYVMRSIWHELAESRSEGHSALQLTLTPALQRGLNLNSRGAPHPATGAATTPAPSASTPTP